MYRPVRDADGKFNNLSICAFYGMPYECMEDIRNLFEVADNSVKQLVVGGL